MKADAKTTTLSALKSMNTADLESVFASEAEFSVPEGMHRGHFLKWLDHPAARCKRWRWPQRLAFEWAPFGIDFDRRLWFFFDPRLAAGRFEVHVQPSRWRETQALGLHYEVSRLPAPVRSRLYDEVKPLGPDLALGLGGINAGPGAGDHFFFALIPW